MKLTSLEIERSRRVADRDATLERVRLIDERLQAITQEQQDISRLLDHEPSDGDAADAPRPNVRQTSANRMNLKY